MKSYYSFTATGDTNKVTVPFLYLSKSHVSVTVDGVPAAIASWDNAGVAVLASVPAAGSVVRVSRSTPTNPTPIEFRDGAVWAATDFNSLVEYSAFLAEESKDSGEGAMRENALGEFDGQGKVISNVADGTAPGDAVNLGQLNAMQAGVLAAQSAAEAAVGTATAIATAAGASATEAQSSANAAAAALLALENAAPLKVAVLGDSLSSQHDATGDAWPFVMERNLRMQGADVEVENFAVSGWSFYRAANWVSHSSKTALQACIDSKPDVVILALGYNDLVNQVDSRTLAQVTADATAVVSALTAGIAGVRILVLQEMPWDDTHFPTPTSASPMKNAHIIPAHWLLGSSDVFTGLRTQDKEDVALTTGVAGAFANLYTLNQSLAALSGVTAAAPMRLYRVARLGGYGQDGMHPNEAGCKLMAGYATKAMRSTFNADLGGIVAGHIADGWSDPDVIFATCLQSNGTKWVPVAGPLPEYTEMVLRQGGRDRSLHPQTWWLGTDWDFHITAHDLPLNPLRPFAWSIEGAPAGATVYVSVDGGAWSTIGTVNEAGRFADLGNGAALGAAAGTYQFTYRVGNECWPAQTITLTADTDIPVTANLTAATEIAPGNYLNTGDLIPIKKASAAGSFKTTIANLVGRITSLAWTWTAKQNFSSGVSLGDGTTVKAKVMTGTLPANGDYITVAHGLPDWSKIIGFAGSYRLASANTAINIGYYVPPYTDAAVQVGADATTLIVRNGAESAPSGTPWRVVIFYTA